MMKVSPAVIAALLFASLVAAQTASCDEVGEKGGRVFTIKDAIGVAFINNKFVQIQEQEIEFAKADILYAKSQFLPQVETSYSYTLNDAVLKSTGAGGRKDPGVWTGYKNDNMFSLSLNESIYNGGANIAALQQARVQLKIQQETLRATKLDVEFETRRLFYGLLLAYETLRIARDLVDQAQAHYDETKRMFGQGTVSKFDLLQAKVQVSKLIPQLVNAQNAIDLIMPELKKSLGVDMIQPIALDGELAYQLVDINEDEFIQESYAKNPQMILRLLGVDLNRWAIEFAKAGWLPQISADAGYSYRSNNLNNMVNPRHDLWNVGVKASIALFDGFATKAKVDEARARYAQAGLNKENIMDQIVVDIKSACTNLKKAKAVIDSQEDIIVEAEESLRLANVRYRNGIGISLDVFDAEVSLAQVEQYLAQGIYDYIMAKAQLDRTMGRDFQFN